MWQPFSIGPPWWVGKKYLHWLALVLEKAHTAVKKMNVSPNHSSIVVQAVLVLVFILHVKVKDFQPLAQGKATRVRSVYTTTKRLLFYKKDRKTNKASYAVIDTTFIHINQPQICHQSSGKETEEPCIHVPCKA